MVGRTSTILVLWYEYFGDFTLWFWESSITSAVQFQHKNDTSITYCHERIFARRKRNRTLQTHEYDSHRHPRHPPKHTGTRNTRCCPHRWFSCRHWVWLYCINLDHVIRMYFCDLESTFLRKGFKHTDKQPLWERQPLDDLLYLNAAQTKRFTSIPNHIVHIVSARYLIILTFMALAHLWAMTFVWRLITERTLPQSTPRTVNIYLSPDVYMITVQQNCKRTNSPGILFRIFKQHP